MPFQSEKQRRYLWANEPEIARDWTDTYGSKIQKANGGRIGFAKGSDPRALKQRFIEVIRLMHEAEGQELAALALEARTLKEQLKVLEQIEPSVGQGIQSLQRRMKPQGTALLPKEFTGRPRTQEDQGYQIFPKGYGEEQIFPGIRTESILELEKRKPKPISQAAKGRIDKKDVERLKERLKRHRPSRANGGLLSIRQPYGSGGEILKHLLLNWGRGKVKEKGQELGYFPEPSQKKGMGSFLGRILATMFLGPMGGFAWDLGSGYMNKRGSSFAPNANMPNFNNLGSRSGYGSQRGYEKARQDRINMKRQSDIIKTFQSGKYAPDWEKSAFERVQKLGKNLNLVDAGDVGLTGKSKSAPVKKTITPSNPGRPHGNGGGGGNAGGASLSSGMTTGQHAAFRSAQGGLAGLWQR